VASSILVRYKVKKTRRTLSALFSFIAKLPKTRYGVNRFDLDDDGVWELRHPALPNIDPDDFVFAAEYLESDDFGDQMDEAFAQCIAAWGVAEKLGMHDFMDHIIDKLERHIEPELLAIFIFATQVYGAGDNTGLLSQERLKDYLATYIAENWWIFLADDHLSGGFIEGIQKLPELERDIYARRMAALNERLDTEEDGSGDGDMDAR